MNPMYMGIYPQVIRWQEALRSVLPWIIRSRIKYVLVVCAIVILIILSHKASFFIDKGREDLVRNGIHSLGAGSVLKLKTKKLKGYYNAHHEAANVHKVVIDFDKYAKKKQNGKENDSFQSSAKYGTCAQLFKSGSRLADEAKLFTRPLFTEDKILEQITTWTENCHTYKNQFGYATVASAEELKMPIAFSIPISHQVEQWERLLRAIYRPHNYYCVFLGSHTGVAARKAVSAVMGCLPNVKMVVGEWPRPEEGTLACAAQLKVHTDWHHLVTLAAQDFPLRTNLELVRIFRDMGSDNIIGLATKKSFTTVTIADTVVRLYEGTPNNVISRVFLEFIIDDSQGQAIHNAIKRSSVLGYALFATLYYNPLHIPAVQGGSSPANAPAHDICRYQVTNDRGSCHGIFEYGQCSFGVGDLPTLGTRWEFFASKFVWDFQPLAFDCLDELISNRTARDTLGQTQFDTSYYKYLTA